MSCSFHRHPGLLLLAPFFSKKGPDTFFLPQLPADSGGRNSLGTVSLIEAHCKLQEREKRRKKEKKRKIFHPPPNQTGELFPFFIFGLLNFITEKELKRG